VAEALEVLSKLQYVSANNYLLADRSGDMAVVETSADRVRVRRPSMGESFIICTNHFVHPEMQEMEDLELRQTEGLYTQERYTDIHDTLEQSGKSITIEKAQEILSSHEGHVCCHWKEWEVSTLWSVAASLKRPVVYTAEGSPCKAKFRPDFRLKY
jgi:predicted choloylglycine hydrolase